MRRSIWVFLLLCLFIVFLLCFQLSQASATLRVNEATTRFLLEDGRTGASLGVENSLGHKLEANMRVELIDPQGHVRSSVEREETIKEGAATLFIPLPFQFSALKEPERQEFLWYRLRYRITPKDSSDAASKTEGIISLSTITPDLFEVHVASSAYAREGARYRARVRAVHPINGQAVEFPLFRLGLHSAFIILFLNSASPESNLLRFNCRGWDWRVCSLRHNP